MSYALAFSPEASADFARLPAWLQEELLDVVDATAESLPAQSRPRSFPSLVLDCIRVQLPLRHYVFATVSIDHRAATLRVLRIGHYSRAE